MLVLAADTLGHPANGLRVSVDGVVRSDFSNGRPIAVDPGRHALRVEAEGAQPIEQAVEVVAGQKNRVLSFRMESTAVTALPSPAVVLAPPPSVTRHKRHEPAVFYVFAVLAAGGVLTFAGLGTAGVVDYEVLKGQCGSSCSDGRVRADHTLLVGADIALVVALVSGGAAALSHLAGSF